MKNMASGQGLGVTRIYSATILREWLSYAVKVLEGQRASLFHWVPVFLAFGVGAYFSLPSEPPLMLGVMGSLICLGAYVLLPRQSIVSYLVLAALLISLGFSAAIIRSSLSYTEILEKDLGPVTVSGRISDIETLEGESAARVTLSHVAFKDKESQQVPKKVRIRVRDLQGLEVGDEIEILAQLHPPSGPLIPGGFDFRRYLYFKQIGAVGFAYHPPELIQPGPQFFAGVNHLRRSVVKNIKQALGAKEAGVASALITGQKSDIQEADLEAMRDAGLAHVLAISGLHIGLFAGFVFFVVRAGLVLVPGAALQYPVKKYAALVAMAAGFGYLALSGFSISAQRALIMAMLVFTAIILDRMALSLRLVAFAAAVILLISPDSLLSPGFQMSFAAVLSLVVAYDAARPWLSGFMRHAGWGKRLAMYFMGICATTVIASLATAPFALFHFQQVASYSLLGNLLTIPVLGFYIMPLAVISLVLMPFGLSYLPLMMMGIGIDWVLDTAYWVQSLPYSVLHVSYMPLSALISFVFGVLVMFLLKGEVRWAGVLGVLFALLLTQAYQRPDVLISDSGKLWAVSGSENTLYLSQKRREKFVIENWEKGYGLLAGEGTSWPKEGRLEDGGMTLSCGEAGCRLQKNGQKVSFLMSSESIAAACDWADVVIVSDPVPDWRCRKKQVIDLFDSFDHGAYALWLRERGVTVQNAADIAGKRPWS